MKRHSTPYRLLARNWKMGIKKCYRDCSNEQFIRQHMKNVWKMKQHSLITDCPHWGRLNSHLSKRPDPMHAIVTSTLLKLIQTEGLRNFNKSLPISCTVIYLKWYTNMDQKKNLVCWSQMWHDWPAKQHLKINHSRAVFKYKLRRCGDAKRLWAQIGHFGSFFGQYCCLQVLHSSSTTPHYQPQPMV